MRPRSAYLALALTIVLSGCCMPPALSLGGATSPATPAGTAAVTSAGALPGMP